jgi:GTP-binding protein
MLPFLPEAVEDETNRALRVAIIGRPNVGKSALVNALLGQERVIVSEIAGTTRDAIDTPFEYDGQPMTLIDTAGIRRPGKVEGSIEHYSVLRSREAVKRADVAVVVFDASMRLRAQDLHIVGIALEENTGLVVCANKWDLIKETWDEEKFRAGMRRRLNFATWAPIVVISALERTGLDELMREVRAAGEERRRRVQTSELNAIIRGALARRPPTLTGRKRLKLLYVTQVRTDPPTFVFFVNDASLVSQTYRRYLENALRRFFGYKGAGLRLIFRTRGEDGRERD